MAARVSAEIDSLLFRANPFIEAANPYRIDKSPLLQRFIVGAANPKTHAVGRHASCR